MEREKLDKIHNALLVGLSQADAFVYAGLTETEIELATKDPDLQRTFAATNKALEFTLLNRMNEISEKQVRMGKEGATAWMLEKLYPRYGSKPQGELPEIHIHMKDDEPTDYDNVTVFNPTVSNGD